MLKACVGYVEQFDTLLPELTVREMLTYAATFKLRQLSRQQIQQKVDDVLQQLLLEDCQHTIIGDKMHRGVSGGQAKRVNIGLALLTSPSVIFLDEPTSGLDSKTADTVIECLRRLADGGHTVVATIHSPSAYAFGLFDSLLMLKRGEIIYQGPLANDAAHAKEFFQNQGFGARYSMRASGTSGEVDHSDGTSQLLPMSMSSVEWLVETITASDRKHTPKSKINSDSQAVDGTGEYDFAAAYRASPLCADNKHRMEQLLQSAREQHTTHTHIKTTSKTTTGGGSSCSDGSGGNVLHATWTLLRFRGASHLTSSKFLLPRVAPPIFYALVLWSLFAGIGTRAASGDIAAAQSVSGLFFVTVVLCGYGAAPFVPSIALDRPIFYRDRADGYYGSAAYVLAKLVEDAVAMLGAAVVYSLIVFYGCELQGSFGVFFGVRFLASMVGVALAYWSAAVSPDMASACALLPAVVTVCQFMSGFVIVYQAMPSGWEWFYRINFLQYGFAALMTNEFGGGGTGTAQLQMYSLAGDGLAQDTGFCVGVQAAILVVVLVITIAALALVKHG